MMFFFFPRCFKVFTVFKVIENIFYTVNIWTLINVNCIIYPWAKNVADLKNVSICFLNVRKVFVFRSVRFDWGMLRFLYIRLNYHL